MMQSVVEPAPTAPLVAPELKSLWRNNLPSGPWARQSVNVPPTSTQNSHGLADGIATGYRNHHDEQYDKRYGKHYGGEWSS
jgi:hypothetical protein